MEHNPRSKAFRASTALLTPWPWSSSLRSWEGVSFCGFKHSLWCSVMAALEKEHTFRLQGQKTRTGTRTCKERSTVQLSPHAGPPSLAGWAAEPSFEKWSLLPCGWAKQEGHLYCWPGIIKIISKLPQGASGRWFGGSAVQPEGAATGQPAANAAPSEEMAVYELILLSIVLPSTGHLFCIRYIHPWLTENTLGCGAKVTSVQVSGCDSFNPVPKPKGSRMGQPGTRRELSRKWPLSPQFTGQGQRPLKSWLQSSAGL